MTQIQLPIQGSVKQIHEIQGIYEDLWVGQQFRLILESQYPTREIQLQGYIPATFAGENQITLTVGNTTQQIAASGNQNFQVTLPVQILAGERITIEGNYEKTFNLKQQQLGEDQRDLGFLLLALELKRGKTAGEYLKEGKLFEIQDALDEAVHCYQQAIALHPSFAWSYYHLGEVLMKQGKKTEAIAWYNKANQLNPKLAWCYSLLPADSLTEKQVYETNSLNPSPHL
jgi:tetratricopeptide (TPR) repeat protein